MSFASFMGMGGGGLIGEGLNLIGTAGATEKSRTALNKQLSHQMVASNTAHQRQMEDMRAAGLNPILSGQYGGASTPAGASMKFDNPFDGAGARGLALGRQMQEYKNMKAQERQTDSQTSINEKQLDVMDEIIKKAIAEARQANSAANVNDFQAALTYVDTQLRAAGLPAALNQAAAANTEEGRAADFSRYVVGEGSSAASLVARGGLTLGQLIDNALPDLEDLNPFKGMKGRREKQTGRRGRNKTRKK